MEFYLPLALAAILSFAFGWAIAHFRSAAKVAVLEERLRSESAKDFEQAFQALAAKALESNNESFLTLAKTTLEKYQEGAKYDLAERQKAIDTLVGPLKESIQKVDTTVDRLSKERAQADVLLQSHVTDLKTAHESLKEQTGNLARALRNTVTRGRWGELQLRRVVEMSGMLEHCDFTEQTSISTEDGRLRPDMLIRLPNNKLIVVDSKCPLEAYLDAHDSQDEARKVLKLKEHAKAVRSHISSLSQKSYWSQFPETPEFVVLFLPGEPYFGAAVENDPGLIEYGVEQRVLIATPINLIALLRSVAYGWQQTQLTKNAEEISSLGKALYDRLFTFAEHFSAVGRSLDKAVKSYNDSASSFASRALVTARRFKELGAAGGDDIPAPIVVEKLTRPLSEESAGDPRGD